MQYLKMAVTFLSLNIRSGASEILFFSLTLQVEKKIKELNHIIPTNVYKLNTQKSTTDCKCKTISGASQQ
jgi:hypothetical protein